ncbi:MAG: VWA domain-containing protein [Candidatus Omnitrophota bacterium]
MKTNKKILTAVIISCAAHSAFLALSTQIMMPGMRHVRDQTRKIFRIREVQKDPAKVSLFEEITPHVSKVKMDRNLTPLQDETFKRMMLDQKSRQDLSVEEKKESLKDEHFKDMLNIQPQIMGTEDIIKHLSEDETKKHAPKKRSLAQRLLTEDIIGYSNGPATIGREVQFSALSKIEAGSIAKQDAWEAASIGVNEKDEDIVLAGEIVKAGNYEDISRHLDVDLSTYTSPETQKKYFKVVIAVKDKSYLEVIPKEVIFLIDSSKSITEEKLYYIKEGVFNSLKNFNQGDRFNVVAFRGSLLKFKDESVEMTAETVDEVEDFIEQFKAIGQTDVETALLNIIKEPVVMNPSYIVIITDGRPTTGVIDSRRIVQQITRENGMQRPIFCFGGGLKVNKYLLDFISYQNRAWCRFAATTYDMKKDFEEFYRQLKDPLLLNVRYRVKGIDSEEVYPKYLSDFYRGKPFVIYGQYANEDIFAMQLLGNINGTAKEFIFKRSFNSAAKGGEEIAREWAFRKIYHLISLNTMGIGDTKALRSEIEVLSEKYNITTPYNIKNGD